MRKILRTAAIPAAMILLTVLCHTASAARYQEFSESDKMMLAKAVRIEAANEGILTKICFISTTFNDLHDVGFSGNLKNTVLYGGNFRRVTEDKITSVRDGDCVLERSLVEIVLQKDLDPTGGAVFWMSTDDTHLWEITETFRCDGFAFGRLLEP